LKQVINYVALNRDSPSMVCDPSLSIAVITIIQKCSLPQFELPDVLVAFELPFASLMLRSEDLRRADSRNAPNDGERGSTTEDALHGQPDTLNGRPVSLVLSLQLESGRTAGAVLSSSAD
jgi:hypothetical protein